MNFPSQTKNRQRIWMKYLMGGGLFFIVVGLLTHQSLFTYYTELLGSSVQLNSLVATLLADKEDLREENKELRQQLQTQIVAASLAEANQQAYLELAAEMRKLEGRVVLADIVSKPPLSPYDQYIIDIGSHDEVEQYQLVVAQGQYLVGYISRLSPRYALVTLFSSPGVSTQVSIDGALYEATGRGNGILVVQLPRSYRDVSDKEVHLPGSGPYVLGRLLKTEFDPQDSFVKGIITLPVAIGEQERAAVVEYRYRGPQTLNTIFNEE